VEKNLRAIDIQFMTENNIGGTRSYGEWPIKMTNNNKNKQMEKLTFGRLPKHFLAI